jgi:hypothetical protein
VTPQTTNRIIDQFFLPYIALRNRGHGYAVSIVKAGATIAGHTAGPVRPPLSDLKPTEFEELRALIAKLGPQAVRPARRRPSRRKDAHRAPSSPNCAWSRSRATTACS